MSRPRVLITGPTPPPPGGIASVIHAIVESELAERFELTRFDTTKACLASKQRLVHYCDAALSRGLGFDGAWNLEAAAKLAAYRAVLAPRPDLIHLHTSHGYDFWLGIRMARIARGMGLPVLLHVHGLFDVVVPTWPPLRRACFPRALRVPDRVIVLSEGWQRWFTPYIPCERLVVLRNPVDASRFRSRDTRASTDVLRLLFVGTREPERKGGNEILAAAPAVIAGAPQVRFVFVGEDTERLYETRVRGGPLEPFFEFTGSKDAREIVPYFEAADVLLLPSHAEGLPIAMLEGMAAALPIIACPVNGIPEAMSDPENGLFVPPRDPAALAKAILRLVEDPAARQRMGALNREKALREFDRPQFARNLGAVYDETLATRRAAR